MNVLVERVARAIAEADMKDFEAAPNLYEAKARAAIAAMREPTKAMTDAFLEHDEIGEPVGASKGWQLMIDAALGT